MGRGIAELAARSDYRVVLADAIDGAATRAIATIGQGLDRDVEKKRLTAEEAAAVKARLSAGAIADIARTGLVIEAIVEKLDVKQALFREIEALAGPTTVLATNTSSLAVTAIGDGLKRPERLAGLHFFNPPTRMRIVEIVKGARTDDAAIDTLLAVSRRMGQRAFVVGDTPGFLVNHLGRGFTGEALRMLDEGIAPPEVIDRIARQALGFRMGPFELLDLTGIDVTAEVTDQIWKGFGEEPRFRLAPIARKQGAAGLFGRKTGRGFYRYDAAGKAEVPAPPVYEELPLKVRLVGMDGGTHERIAALFPEGSVVEDPGAAALVAPLGSDVATEAKRHGTDPARTVGIDPLFTDMVTLAGTRDTPAGIVEGVAATLSRAGREVAIVHDGPGMPAARLVTMMALIAADAAGRGIGTPADIDAATRLALAYPLGPLERADKVGPERVAAIAAGLHALTGDARWRPSEWLDARIRSGNTLAESLPDKASAPN
jgi:3-hydroxybutyryl-CoA dehydrogenase